MIVEDEGKRGVVKIITPLHKNEAGIEVVKATVDDTTLELTPDIAGAVNRDQMVQILLSSFKSSKLFRGRWDEKKGDFVPSE